MSCSTNQISSSTQAGTQMNWMKTKMGSTDRTLALG